MFLGKFILEHRLAPGDVVATTSLVRDLKLKYGNDIQLDFRTNMPEIYANNPHLTPLQKTDPDVRHVELCYKNGIPLAAREKLHFTTYFHRDFTEKTGIAITPQLSKPDLHLSEYERTTPPITGRYWLVFGGGKSDMLTKHWEYEKYQQVVDRLRPFGLRFVQSGAARRDHTHPPMNNVLNVVGWGTLKHMMWQIAHCEGVICPITCAMHMAAAFDKPCVVIAGGREEPWWEAYVDNYGAFGPDAAPVVMPHKYLHTLGLLDCCEVKGCWKRKLTQEQCEESARQEAKRTGKIRKAEKPCQLVVIGSQGQLVPKCMQMITVDHVVEAVMSYYEEGKLPPIGLDTKQESELKV